MEPKHQSASLVRIAQMAAGQGGAVNRRQLQAEGLSRSAIQNQRKRGHIRNLFHGVYAVGQTPISPRGSLMSAVLAGGPGTVASYRSAAWLHGFWGRHAPHEVTRTFGGASGRRQTPVPDANPIYIHRTRRLPEGDVTDMGGIPVTTVERTFIDLAGVLTERELERAMFEARRRQLIDVSRFEHRLAGGGQGHRGIRALADLVFGTPAEVGLTRSDAEAWMIELFVQHGIRVPLINHRIGGIEVDFVWMPEKLAAELDSRTYHGDTSAFQRDRSRDRRLTLAGFRVLRFTYRDLRERPALVAAEISAALAQAHAAR